MLAKLVSVRRRLLGVLDTLRFLPPLLSRFVLGWVFVWSGWGKLHDLGTVVDFFRQLGIPAPELQAPFVASVEFVGGLAMLLGLGTRVAAVFLSGTMIVAIATARWADAATLIDLFGFEETLFLVLCVWLGITGPGAVSLDALVARRLDLE